MKRIFTLLFVLTIFQIQAQTVEPFLPKIFSQFENVRDLAISPDGKEIYFTIETPKKEFSTIAYIKKKGKKWSKPKVASFSGQFKDLEPFFSPDGLKMYFASARPTDKKSDQPKDIDIWVVSRTTIQSKWSKATNIGAPVNTEKDEFYPSVATSGNLYFTRAVANRKEDIFMSKWKDNTYQSPTALSDSVNSKLYEYNAFVTLDESMIIFTSYGRKEEMGGSDMFYSKKKKDGSWTTAKHLTALNSNKIDYCPFVKDGYLYFTSERSEVPKSFKRKQTIKDLKRTAKQYTNGMGRIYRVKIDL